MRLLCVASRLLGNKSFAVHLIDALNAIDGLTVDCHFIDPEDYRIERPPGWTRLSAPLEVDRVARRKFASLSADSYDALIVSVWDLLPAVSRLASRLPTALALDTTPLGAARMKHAQRRWVRAPIAYAGQALQDFRFRRAIRNVEVFLPMTEWCAESLRDDYAVAPERLLVTWTPIDLATWVPISRPKSELPHLLFVGNDLERKGFPTLLSMFRDHGLGNECVLRVVSADPQLRSIAPTAGVELLGTLARNDLLRVYQDTDLFVLPTRMDYSPHVLAEAAATGVAALASDVGAIRNQVRDGRTGRLLHRRETPAAWAAATRALLADRTTLLEMGRGARSLAEQLYGIGHFRQVIRGAVDRLQKAH